MIFDYLFLQANYIAPTGNQHTILLAQEHQSYTAIMHHRRLKPVLLIFCTFFTYTHAISAAYGVCQASCAVVVAACYVANGAVFGAVRAAGAPPALLRCNTAFGTCQATCSTIYDLESSCEWPYCSGSARATNGRHVTWPADGRGRSD